MFKGMIELYHFFAEYYKTIPGNISIMKLQKHKKNEKLRKHLWNEWDSTM